MCAKVHAEGGAKGRQARKRQKLLEHQQKRREQIKRQVLHRKRQDSRRITRAIQSIAAPHLLAQWVRGQRLIIKRQLKNKEIKPFNYYCRLLAMDALFSGYMPKKRINVGGVKYTPTERQLLERTQKRDILERLNEIASPAERIGEVKKQIKNLRKTLPKTLQKVA